MYYLAERTADKDVSRYVLTLEQMVENDYPVPSYMADIFQKPDGWVETPAPPQSSLLDAVQPQKKVKAKVYALDCEMCLTEDGKELTHVCVIDYFTGTVIYDQLVKPPKPIVDYLTQWSGITKEALEGVTTTLPTVQAAILELLSPPAPAPTPILLGHSLESDLRALKLCHPSCIDTALTYHHPRGRPLKPGLAWLTKKWCGRVIQARGAGGHDPEEDARACVELLRKKLENGEGFGEFKTDYESIFERLARSGGGSGAGAGTVRSAVVDHGNPGVMHGAKAGTCVGCTSDEEVANAVVEVVPGHEFIFGRLTGLAGALGWLTPKDTPSLPGGAPASTPLSAPPPDEPSSESLIPVLSTLNAHLTRIPAVCRGPPKFAVNIFRRLA